MGFEDEAEQSIGRPCRQTNDRSKRTNELTSSIVPRGISFHRLVELEFSPIACDPELLSCHCGLPGPLELGTVNPYAVHDHGQPARQRHDRLLHPAVPGDLHGPGFEPGPLVGAAPVSALARSKIDLVPNTIIWARLDGERSARARQTISGPTPAGSPMVMPTLSGRVIEPCPVKSA